MDVFEDMSTDQQLAFLISEHMNEYVLAFTKIMDNDVSAPQYYVLMRIAEEGSKTSSELANCLGVSLPAVTNLTTKLEKKGYVERTVSESDRRQYDLHLTDEGKAIVKRMMEKHFTLFKAIQTAFTEDEKLRLIDAYQKMIVTLKQETNS